MQGEIMIDFVAEIMNLKTKKKKVKVCLQFWKRKYRCTF